MKAGYEAAIFDLDGTLLDYAAAQRQAVEAVARELELDTDSQALLELVGGEEVQALEACRPNAPKPESPEMESAFRRCGVEAAPRGFLRLYYRRLSEHHETLEGALETLQALREAGLSIGLVSNGPGAVQRPRIRESGLIEYLDAVVLSCEVGMAKPDPEILLLALRLLKTEAEKAIFVGDSTRSDLPAAARAGVDFALIDPEGGFAEEGPRVLNATGLKEVTELLLPGS